MKKIKLKNYQVGELFQAIKSLDGRPEVIKDHDGKTIGIVQNKPFKLDIKVRYALAKTLISIRPIVEIYELAQKTILSDNDETNETQKRLSKELYDLSQIETEVEVHELNVTLLQVDTNEISPTVLMQLNPMLHGEW